VSEDVARCRRVEVDAAPILTRTSLGAGTDNLQATEEAMALLRWLRQFSLAVTA
jgi:hypothetical protein